METLYFSGEHCSVKREGEHLKVERSGEKSATIPIGGVRTAVVFDDVIIGTTAIDLLLINGVDIIFMTKGGKIKGVINSMKGGGADIRVAQHSDFRNPERRLVIARSICAAKISNQASVIKKYKYNNTIHDFDEDLSNISQFAGKLGAAKTINEVMGIEGISARYYWKCFGKLLKNPVFERREYRPSPDYVNSLLNLAYAFLCNEITSALTTNKFDLEIGFLHSVHNGRNSLSLDIMEEFRAPFVDTWVLALFNKNQLKEEHFYTKEGEYRLTDDGFRKFCVLYHERVPAWRGKFRVQSDKLKKALLSEGEYEPYREAV